MTTTIRTPDQRLRVFVSSTLAELAPERKAVRAATERLRLAPVMFELGARPHPPADLYRAYLQQSDIFVGLYWESYGWIAPGEEVSGLEDEYLRAPMMPKLMYVKRPAADREPRLAGLLDRVRAEGSMSYKSFTTADELAELIEADLATLLAERFDQSRTPPAEPVATEVTGSAHPVHAVTSLPVPLTELFGRSDDSAEVQRMLARDDVRLVTLHGPGGIGKSRLAVDVAERISEQSGSEIAFVDLAPVQAAESVPNAIAEALGVRDTGDGPLLEKLLTALRDRELLVVVDNFEQVLDAGPALTGLLSKSPRLKIIVTSRALLRVSGEYAFEVLPLALPPASVGSTAAALAATAVALFVERARALRPDFELTLDNLADVIAICRALDGVPLSIELAAARIRMLPPAAMRERLDRQLPLLVGGVRDLPALQKTLRSTVEWSVGLLDEEAKGLLAQLGVFAGGFSLEAAEAVADPGCDVLSALAALVDNTLVRQEDRRGRQHFVMLATVREFARERLEADGVLASLRARHAAYYVRLGDRLETDLEGVQQAELVVRLTDERDNLRAAIRFLLDERDWSSATRLAWALYLYWWVGGLLGEVSGWMREVLEAGEPLSDAARATALYFTRAITFWEANDESIVPGLTESAELFRRAGDPSGEALALISLSLAMMADPSFDAELAEERLKTSLRLFRGANDVWGESMALVTLGRVAILRQQVDGALDRFSETFDIARAQHDELGTAIALHHTGWAHLMLGDAARAATEFEESLRISLGLHHAEGIAYGLEGLVAIAAAGGEVRRAGLLLGASEVIREQTGIYNSPAFSFHRQLLEAFRQGPEAADLESATTEGRALGMDEAVGVALPARASSRS